MQRLLWFMLMAFIPTFASAQQVTCVVFTPETVAKMNAHKIAVTVGLAEYMTATELAAAMDRALHCEIPRPQSVHDLDSAIAWRVTKFARSSEQLNRRFVEYCASYGQDTITSEIATRWLIHNNLVARFNAWDAADVKHNWETINLRENGVGTNPRMDEHPRPVSPASGVIPTKTYMVVGSVDLIQPADKTCQKTTCWWEIIGSHGQGASDGWVVYASPKPNLQAGTTACVKARFPLETDSGPLLSSEAAAAHYPRLTSYRTVDPHVPWGIYEASGSNDSCIPPAQ